MSLIITVIGIVGFYFVMADFWDRLPAEKGPGLRRWFRAWMIKGLLVPVVIWVLFNSAVFDWFPPLVQGVEYARVNGKWLGAIVDVATLGLFVIGTYWAAVTSGWLLAAFSQWTEHPRQYRSCVLVCSAFLLPLAALIILALGWRFAGLAVTFWLLPIAQQVFALQPEENAAPIYTRAVVAMNFDKHVEAEAAVLEELETCEDDFNGWLLLAELYANHFNDLPGAENLIRETCSQPSITPSQFAVAFHRLADWHLKLGADPVSARGALLEICRRHPRSHLDKMARLRLDQLPGTKEELLAKSHRPIHLAPLRRDLDETSGPPAPTLTREEAYSSARQNIDQLKRDPDDIPARETLARLFAEELDEADLGLEQLELLLGMQNPPPGKSAEWLARMAAWQIRYKQNPAAARAILERLMRQYPQSHQAFSAQRRLNLMDMEARMRTVRPA
jgi:hypothetical protein